MNSKEKVSIWQKSYTFLSEVKKEILQVVWPTKKETTLTTAVVCVFAFIMALYLLLVDRTLLFVIQSIMK